MSQPPGERRRSRRYLTTFNALLQSRLGQRNVSLLNISHDGCIVRIRSGVTPAIGETVSVVLLNDRRLLGEVVWLGQQDCGIRFSSKVDVPDDYIHFDEMGLDFYIGVRSRQLGQSQ
jgi:hypothetical protein